MKKKTLLICGILSLAMVLASCGNKTKQTKETATPSPSSETVVKPTEKNDNTSFGQYDITESSDDTLTVKITPKEGASEALETEVTYTFEGEKITAVNYKSIFPSADAAKAAAEKLKVEAANTDVSVVKDTVTYKISKESMVLYDGMTKQDITELTKILNGGQ